MRVQELVLSGLGIALLGVTGCAHRSVKLDAPIPQAVTQGDHDPSLDMTHFAFNSAVLTNYGRQVIDKDAELLRHVRTLKVQVQGYCDDRGSDQYNLKLGENRAIAVKRYLVSLGIAGDRITAVSYGKAKPIDPRDNEKAWAANRRVSFQLLVANPKVALR